MQYTGGPDGGENLSASIDGRGNLITHFAEGDVRFDKPVVYQIDANQQKQMVDGHYVLRADGQLGFEVGMYDRQRELVIDPTMTYSTYLGGSNVDVGMGVALDRFGSCFITGSTLSTDFPTMNPLKVYQGGKDIFITKFNSKASAPEYSTFVGGSGDDVATDIHLDTLGI